MDQSETEEEAALVAAADALFDSLDTRGEGFINQATWEQSRSRDLVVVPLLDRLSAKRDRISSLLGTENILFAFKLRGEGEFEEGRVVEAFGRAIGVEADELVVRHVEEGSEEDTVLMSLSYEVEKTEGILTKQSLREH